MPEKDELASPTLAELYFQQGDIGRAVAILKEVLAGHPENAKARMRLLEMESRLVKSADADSRQEKVRRLKAILERVRKEKGE